MPQAVIGSLRVDLGMNSAQFNKATKRVQKRTQTLGQQISRQMKGIAASFAAAFASGAILRGMQQTIDRLDGIGKTADKIGVSVEALQELRFAADQSGVAVRTFDMALQRFTRRTAEAAAGTGEARDALAELGVQLRDSNGVIRPTGDLLFDVADALRDVESQADRVRLGFKLFDSEGVQVVQMLQDGSENLRRMRAEARRLGIVMREDLVRDAEKMKDELSRQFQALAAQWNRFVITFLRGLDRVFGFIPPTVDEQLADRIGELRRVQDEIRSLAQEPGSGRTLTRGAEAKQLAALREREKQLLSEIRTMEELRQARERAGEALTAAESGLGGGGGAAAVKAAEERKASLQDVLAVMEQEIAALDRRAAVVNMNTVEQARFLAETEALNRARELGLELSERDREMIRLFAKDVGDAAARLQKVREEFAKTQESARETGVTFGSLGNTFRGVFDETLGALRSGASGWQQYANIAIEALNRIVDKLLNQVLDALFQVNSAATGGGSGGGFLGSLVGGIGSLLGLGGGQTGFGVPARNPTGLNGFALTGFADGGIVRKPTLGLVGEAGPEAIIPLREMVGRSEGRRGDGGNTYYIDARGADEAAVQRLERSLIELAGPGRTERRAVAAVSSAQHRGHRLGPRG